MYQWIVFFHIVAAVVWVGGMLFLPLMLVPIVRREEPRTRAALMSTVGWIAIAALLVTGVWNLRNREIPWETILSADLFSGIWGHILAAKFDRPRLSEEIPAEQFEQRRFAATGRTQKRDKPPRGDFERNILDDTPGLVAERNPPKPGGDRQVFAERCAIRFEGRCGPSGRRIRPTIRHKHHTDST